MRKTGTLRVNLGVSRLDGTRLAKAAAGDPFGAATDFLANRGLVDGDFIWVTGTEGQIDNVPVIFISDAGLEVLLILANLANFAAVAGQPGAKAPPAKQPRGATKRGTKESAGKKGAKRNQ